MTPIGEALYPYLTKPDTEYNSEGVYHVKLKVKKEEALKDIKIINDEIAKQVAEQHKKVPGIKELKRAPTPYELSEDGSYVFKFKSKFPPKLYDDTGGALPNDKTIWSKTTMRVKYTPSGYNQSIGIGCTLRLVSCQIDNLVEGNENTTAFEPIKRTANGL